ncbi:Metal tolerance protein 4 [Aphelenchoides besseyi]|nr:Metal tolerance protein 4 [Aphelenchoides besseyi]
MESRTDGRRPSKLEISSPVGFFERRRRLKKVYESSMHHKKDLFNCTKKTKSFLEGNDVEASRLENDREYARKLKWDRRLAVIVFVINLLILAGNLTASILSGSYSVISAFVDSMMDVVSSIVVQITVWAINHTNTYKYPRGRHRLELVSALGCSILMCIANVMMVLQSIEGILQGNIDPNASIPALAILGGGIVAKFLMLIACLRHGSTNAKTLALDMRNDLATNIVAVICAFVGDKFWRFADPVGAILICTCIAGSWFMNALSLIPNVVGRRADHEFEQRIQAVAMKHDPRITALDHVLLFHVGEKAFVELHVVLDEELKLRETHDICESLQEKISSLDFVDRCYVHVDYWCDGRVDGN